MSRVFPRHFKRTVGQTLAVFGLMAGLAVAGVWYYGSPRYYRVGYTPEQPIAFSHEVHVNQVGMDCLSCHNNVRESNHSNIPQTQTCWNCHGADKGNIKSDSPALAPLREAMKSGRPIEWKQVHRTPDYVYFNHAAHVNRGVSCVSCHGQVNEMDRGVTHRQPLSMAWCLDCHRNPEPHLRPNQAVTDLKWDPARDPTLAKLNMSPERYAKYIKDHANISAPVNCYGCHR